MLWHAQGVVITHAGVPGRAVHALAWPMPASRELRPCMVMINNARRFFRTRLKGERRLGEVEWHEAGMCIAWS